jgi:hypothetical protein
MSSSDQVIETFVVALTDREYSSLGHLRFQTRLAVSSTNSWHPVGNCRSYRLALKDDFHARLHVILLVPVQGVADPLCCGRNKVDLRMAPRQIILMLSALLQWKNDQRTWVNNAPNANHGKKATMQGKSSSHYQNGKEPFFQFP